MCLPGGGTHITRDMHPQVGEHISLGICVSQVGEHISLGICVSQVGEHISLGICVSQVEEHTSLGICVYVDMLSIFWASFQEFAGGKNP